MPFEYEKIGKGDLDEIKKYIGRSDFKMYPFGTKDNKLTPQEYYYKDYSIDIIVAYNINLSIKTNHHGQDQTFASFNVYKGNTIVALEDYHVTDPETVLYKNQNNISHYGKVYLIVTIPAKPGGDSINYYKFISAIIPVDGCSTNKSNNKILSVAELIKRLGKDK